MLSQLPLIVVLHLFASLAALVLGGVLLSRRKGTLSHRTLGWLWVSLMSFSALASVFIRDYHFPNVAGFTPIHIFTVITIVVLPIGVIAARRHRVDIHQRAMRRLYIGACVVAGIFTLVPGRFLGNLLWKTWLGVMSG